MSFPAPINPNNVFLFVDQFPSLLSSGNSGMTQFFSFCTAQTINELSTYDILSVLPSQQTLVSRFIYSAKTRYNVSDVGGSINPYNWTPYPEGTKYLQLIITYNNSQPNSNYKYNRVTIENEFWNLETSLNPLKNTAGYTISTTNGSATASIVGGLASSIFSVGNMVKVLGTYRQVIAVGSNTITVDRSFTVSSTNVIFEIRDNLVNQTYAIDFETYLLRLKNIRTLALANNIRVDAYLARKVTQSEYAKLVPFLDKILIDMDYDQNNYTLYNDPTQLNKLRDVLSRCTQPKTGTISTIIGSNILFGTGTDFLNQIGQDSKIVVNNKILTVQSVSTATQAILSQTASTTITSGVYRTYVEFLPIMYMNKTLRKTWMTTPPFTKSYVDVYKFFTLSGYSLSGSVQSGDVPVSYNLETDSNITGATLNSGIAIFDRTQAIGLNIANSSVNKYYLVPNTPYQLLINTINPTCANAYNGVITVQNAVGTVAPYTYNFTGSNNNIVTVTSNNSSYSFSGLTSGVWQVTSSDNSGQLSSIYSVTLSETFLPTVTPNYVNGSYGSVTFNVTGGYNNYYIGTINNSNQYDGNFFVSNLTNGSYTYGAPSNTYFSAGGSYNFIIGDTDGCIKIFQNVVIPTTSSGLSVVLSTTNPTCEIADNGIITASVGTSTSITYPLYFKYSGPNGIVIQTVSSPTIVNSLTTAEPGSWTVTVYDSTLTLSAQSTTTLTPTFNPTVTNVLTNQICFNLVGGTSPYTITSTPSIFSITNPYPTGNNCITGIPGGTYVFTITDKSGCTTNFTRTILNNTVGLALVSVTNPSCDAAKNGIVIVAGTSSNGSPSFSYTATNGLITYNNTSGVFTGLTSDLWTFGVSQGVVVGTSLIFNLFDTFNVNIKDVTGNTICISASGGSTGYYTVDINGTLYPYNTATTVNCYTGVCGSNNIRVVDGDIINTTLSACVYTTTVNGNCNFQLSISATTVKCEDTFGSIIVTPLGGIPPYSYSLTNGTQTINNFTGAFQQLTDDFWTLYAQDSAGNTGTTVINLDGKVNFSATTILSGVCVTVSSGKPPYYIFIDDMVYTTLSAGTYCYSAECGYHGVNVTDSCIGVNCVRTLITVPPQPVGNSLTYESCTGGTKLVLIQASPFNTLIEVCALFGTVSIKGTTYTTSILGLCDQTAQGECYVDNSILVEIPCPQPPPFVPVSDLGIYEIQPAYEPSCSNTNDGVIYFSGTGGVTPYVSYSAINDTQILTSVNGTIFGLTSGNWTVYVKDSVGNIASTTINLDTKIKVSVLYSATSINSTNISVIVNSSGIFGWDPPYLFSIPSLSFSGSIYSDDTEYVFSFTGLQNCNIVNYTICPYTTPFLKIYDFGSIPDDGNLEYELIQANNNKIYGTTQGGGLYGSGILFSCDTLGNYGKIYDFGSIVDDGINPTEIIQASNGVLYGLTGSGGLYGYGTLFSCNTSGNYGKIYDFGSSPYLEQTPIALIQANNNKLYGTTYFGGSYGFGTIWESDTLGNFNVIFSFNGYPESQVATYKLIEISNNKFYGISSQGGGFSNFVFNYGAGTIYSSDTLGNYTLIYTFSGTSYGDGSTPITLIKTNNNIFYGSTVSGGNDTSINPYGGGVIFTANTLGNVGVIKNFDGSQGPVNNIVQINSNLFYGTNYFQILNFDAFGNSNIVYNDPLTLFVENSLFLGNDNNLYGITNNDGLYGQGTIFKFLLNVPPITIFTGCCYEGTIDLVLATKTYEETFSGAWINGVPNIGISITGNGAPYIVYDITIDGQSHTYDPNNNPNYFTADCKSVDVVICQNKIVPPLFTKIHNFYAGSNDGAFPYGSLIQGIDGRLYGMTLQGGSLNNGIIFSTDTLGNFSKLYSFSGTASAGPLFGEPYGSLMQASNGKFYGIASGGINGNGVIFSSDTLGNVGLIYTFNAFAPVNPAGYNIYPNFQRSSLIQAPNGILYGTTIEGGIYNYGNIFSCTTSGNFGLLHSFNSFPGDGTYPIGSLLLASNGVLYGTTPFDNISNYGVIYSCTTSGNYGIIHTFGGLVNGQNPYSTLIQASNGVLYGTASYGGNNYWGVIFSCTTLGNYGIIHHFGGLPTDGGTPYGSLVEASNGILYGMTYEGGLYNNGVVYGIDTSGNYSVIFNFSGSSGSFPYGELIEANDGFLYGMTNVDGLPGSFGTIFKIDITQTNIYGCCYSATVENYLAPIITNTTVNGTPVVCIDLPQDDGTLDTFITINGVRTPADINNINCFTGVCEPTTVVVTNEIQITPLNSYSKIYNFSGQTYSGGSTPYGNLILASNGLLYGTTFDGGIYNYGTIFSSDTNGNTGVIHNFKLTQNGYNPNGSLVQSSNGTLYGMTSYGGLYNVGVIFSCSTSGNYGVVYNFNNVFPNADGAYPASPDPLLLLNDSVLFGTTYQGGTNNTGTVFSCTTSGNYKVIFHCGGLKGNYPRVNLIRANNGLLYGTTSGGGTNNSGTIFSCDTLGNYGTIYNFSPTSFGVIGSLLQASNGIFYGNTLFGGSFGMGTIFSCDTLGNYGIIHNFGGISIFASADPRASLIQASNGLLYGTTSQGGIFTSGVIFTCTTLGNYGVIHNFGETMSEGSLPQNGLLQINGGNFYGMTTYGGNSGLGTIYKYVSSYNSIVCEYSAITGNDYGIDLVGSIINDESVICLNFDNAQLYTSYLITIENNNYSYFYTNASDNPYCIPVTGCGLTDVSISKIYINSYTYNKKYDFPKGTGVPGYNLVQSPTGIFYGVGFNGNRYIYSSSTLNGISPIFTSNVSTGQVGKNLFLGRDGNLYTISVSPDKFLRISPSGSYAWIRSGTITLPLSSFKLSQDINTGDFYCASANGGSNTTNDGYLWSCAENGLNFTNLHTFDDTLNGEGKTPAEGLLLASNGVLYGNCLYGGINNGGTVFSCTTSGNFGVIYYFNGTTQLRPYASLTEGFNGLLYGLAYTTSGYIVFSLTKDGTFDVVHTFTSTSKGAGELLQASNGLLYGIATPAVGNGFVYTIDTSNNNFQIIHQFSGGTIDGIIASNINDNYRLFESNDGTLYGEAVKGGINGEGILFEIDITYKKCPIDYSVNVPCTTLTITAVTVTQPFCCNSASVVITDVQYGVPPYTYSIYNIPTTQTYTNTTGVFTNVVPSTGIWVSQVTDSVGQIDTYQFNLSSTFFADIQFVGTDAIVSFSGADSTTVNVNGGINFYGDSTTQIITDIFGLNCGVNNTVVITGVLNSDQGTFYCTYSAETYFPCDLICDNLFTGPRCPNGINGNISLYALGGTPNYRYSITNGTVTYSANTPNNIYTFTGNTTTPIAAGTWIATIIDANGNSCQQTLTLREQFTATFTATTTGACFTLYKGAGIPPYTVSVNGVPYTAINPPSGQFGTGTFCITFTGCGINVVTINEGPFVPSPCSISFTSNTPCAPLICQVVTTNPGCDINGNPNCTGSIRIGVTGGTPNYTYAIIETGGTVTTFTTSSNSYTFYNLCSGTYTAKVADANGSICSQVVTLNPDYTLFVTGYSISNNCTLGNLCINILGGTPPYDIYVDNTLKLSATSVLNHCFTATCGTNHTYSVTDSTPPCTIYLNQPVLTNTSFNTNSNWILNSSCPGTLFTISGGSLIYTSSTYNTFCAGSAVQNYVFPNTIPLSTTFSWGATTGTITPSNYTQLILGGVFGSTFLTGLNSNNTYSGIKTVPTTFTPSLPYSGYGFAIYNSAIPNNLIEIKDLNLTILSFSYDCRCTITGSTLVPCNPTFTLNLDSYINPTCANSCDGSIIVSATGGVPPYSYTATNGTQIYTNNTGIFQGLCADNWTILSNNDCGGITTLPITLIDSFYVNIDTRPTEFCVTVSGGTPPYLVYLNSILIDTINSGPITVCYTAPCGESTIIIVTDSNGVNPLCQVPPECYCYSIYRSENESGSTILNTVEFIYQRCEAPYDLVSGIIGELDNAVYNICSGIVPYFVDEFYNGVILQGDLCDQNNPCTGITLYAQTCICYIVTNDDINPVYVSYQNCDTGEIDSISVSGNSVELICSISTPLLQNPSIYPNAFINPMDECNSVLGGCRKLNNCNCFSIEVTGTSIGTDAVFYYQPCILNSTQYKSFGLGNLTKFFGLCAKNVYWADPNTQGIITTGGTCYGGWPYTNSSCLNDSLNCDCYYATNTGTTPGILVQTDFQLLRPYHL
jgi:uncharacterized repeat protein (TIGR03803 family)